jgi:transposase
VESLASAFRVRKTELDCFEEVALPLHPLQEKKIGGVGLANDKFYSDGHEIYIPKFGMVNMTESLRFEGKIKWGRVKEHSGCWFITLAVDVMDQPKADSNASIGIDFGLKTLAEVLAPSVAATDQAAKQ